ncbi:MAG: hypothetical protein NTX88_01720, partial [Candidatus Atribacteria bacterium]|nr:hypothetical protein [Candidatus Atribacteria bacterium]
MNNCNSIFGQILQIFNRFEFEKMVRETKSEMTLSLRGGKRRGNLIFYELSETTSVQNSFFSWKREYQSGKLV